MTYCRLLSAGVIYAVAIPANAFVIAMGWVGIVGCSACSPPLNAGGFSIAVANVASRRRADRADQA